MTDLFSVRPELRLVREKDSASSQPGKIFSMVIVLLLIALAIYSGTELYYRENPKTNLIDQIIEDPPEIAIDSDIFAFSFGLETPDSYEMFINESIYQVTFSEITKIRTYNEGQEVLNYQNRDIELERCSVSHFGDSGYKFVNASLNYTYCISPNQSNGVPSMQGVWESDYNKYLRINIRTCTNGTKAGVTCGTPDEISAKIRRGFFKMNYVDLVFDPSNFNEPVYKFRNAFHTNTDDRYSRTVSIDLGIYEVISDTGIVGSSYSSNEHVSITKFQEFMFPNGRGTLILAIEMQLDRNKNISTRTYLKLVDIFSQVNGMFASLFLIFSFIMKPFAKYKYYEELINEIFEIKLAKKSEKSLLESIFNPKRARFLKNEHAKSVKPDPEKCKEPPNLNDSKQSNINLVNQSELTIQDQHQPEVFKNTTEEKIHSTNNGDNEIPISNHPDEYPEKQLNREHSTVSKATGIESHRPELRLIEVQNPSRNKRAKAPTKLRVNKSGICEKIKKYLHCKRDLKEKEEIHLGFFEYYFSFIWKSEELKEKLSVLNEGIAHIKNRMNAYTIMEGLDEIELILMLFLSENQREILKHKKRKELPSKSSADDEENEKLKTLELIKRQSINVQHF